MSKKKFVVVLEIEQRAFIKGDAYFNKLKDCEAFIKIFERIMPENKGKYKIYELNEVML